MVNGYYDTKLRIDLPKFYYKLNQQYNTDYWFPIYNPSIPMLLKIVLTDDKTSIMIFNSGKIIITSKNIVSMVKGCELINDIKIHIPCQPKKQQELYHHEISEVNADDNIDDFNEYDIEVYI